MQLRRYARSHLFARENGIVSKSKLQKVAVVGSSCCVDEKEERMFTRDYDLGSTLGFRLHEAS